LIFSSHPGQEAKATHHISQGLDTALNHIQLDHLNGRVQPVFWRHVVWEIGPRDL
jgi:hypothetical protein